MFISTIWRHDWGSTWTRGCRRASGPEARLAHKFNPESVAASCRTARSPRWSACEVITDRKGRRKSARVVSSTRAIALAGLCCPRLIGSPLRYIVRIRRTGVANGAKTADAW
jgi:hypothetical protein